MSEYAVKTETNKRAGLIAAVLILLGFSAVSAHAAGSAIRLNLDGALGVATAEYIIGGIDQAQSQDAPLIIIRMDTPGSTLR